MTNRLRFWASIILIVSCLYRVTAIMIVADYIGNVNDVITLIKHVCMLIFESSNYILIVKAFLDFIEK